MPQCLLLYGAVVQPASHRLAHCPQSGHMAHQPPASHGLTMSLEFLARCSSTALSQLRFSENVQAVAMRARCRSAYRFTLLCRQLTHLYSRETSAGKDNAAFVQYKEQPQAQEHQWRVKAVVG